MCSAERLLFLLLCFALKAIGDSFMLTYEASFAFTYDIRGPSPMGFSKVFLTHP